MDRQANKDRGKLYSVRRVGRIARNVARALRSPIPAEHRHGSARRWDDLPESLRTPEQIVGLAHHSCGATHGVMERCDFACTSCYLGEEANSAAPLEREAVHDQLDCLRRFLGPQGKAQITSGEVTLLPREVLGGYVWYAKSIGLDPMVMTHGRRWLDEPEYLQELVGKDGLEKSRFTLIRHSAAGRSGGPS